MEVQSLYQIAIKFAAKKHHNQTIPGSELPYLLHISNVAMEIIIAAQHTPDFNVELALPIALLHDTIEDTDTSFMEIEAAFGLDVAKGVLALTKNDKLPKQTKILESISRIKQLQTEVWAVKMADRITNLQPPPKDWDRAKRIKYKTEAQIILNQLKDGNIYLAKRLEKKIIDYSHYFDEI